MTPTSAIGIWGRCLTLVLLTVVVAGCEKPASKPAAPGSIEVSPSATLLWQLGDTTTLSAQVKASDGSALDPQPDLNWSSTDSNVISVDANGVVTAVAQGEAYVQVSADGVTGQSRILVDTSASTITGQIGYRDKEYTPSGFNDSKVYYKDVRFAQVDLLDAAGNILQSTSTDANGQYTLDPVLPGDYSVRVVAKTDAGSGIDVEVDNLNGALYAVTEPLTLTGTGTAATINIADSSPASGAFNILDVFTTGAQFVNNFAGTYPPALKAFWSEGQGLGTYYCTGADSTYCTTGKGIYVYNAYSSSYGGDTDEYDDDVLWHEYGHFIADAFSGDDSQGGTHYLSDNTLDMRLAWSEGWGDYFPTAIKQWLDADGTRRLLLSTASGTPVSQYVDTQYTSGSNSGVYISIDIGSPGSSPYVYATSEVSIANLLWQFTETFGTQAVWDVIDNYMQSPTDSGGNVVPVNFEAFWDGWLALGKPLSTSGTTAQSILNSRLVHYEADGYENDDVLSTSRKATLGSAETHYLYGDTDSDIVAFDATAGTTYVIKTYDLRNGADTHIRLRDGAGNYLNSYENDDSASLPSTCSGSSGYPPNDGTCLSSQTTFTPASTGTYYVEVTKTLDPQPYPSAGRYGTYTLLIQAQ